MFEPIRTDRVLLRPARLGDVDDVLARRNDPEVAEFQDWTLPYTRERAEQSVVRAMSLDGPTVDEWWMLTVADVADTVVYGDLVVHLTWEGRTAEIGYTFAREWWGHGFAAEAAGALVAHLFDDVGVHRVEAKLHPDNAASAMLLERIGMRFEGHTRSSFWLDDENSDDWIYGMTCADREAWRDRPRSRPATVQLVEIDADSMSAVRRLVTHKSQERFVAPVWASYGDALFPEVVDGAPLIPWMRAIEADGELVGFVMLALTTEAHPEPYLWRLLIDRMHQRRGIATSVLDLLVEQCRTWGDRTLMVSWEEGKGSPEPLYLGYGFERTGNIVDGEIEGRLTFES